MTHTAAAQLPRRPRRLAAAGAVLVALGVAGCAGQGGQPSASPTGSAAAGSPTGSAGASASPSRTFAAATPSGAPSSGAAATGPSGTDASPSSAGSPLSLDMPASLDAERVRAVTAVVDAAAPGGSETGRAHHSPLERATNLRSGAKTLPETVRAANPSASIGPAEQACLDATRKGLEADAERGAAEVVLTVQPATATTTGGAGAAPGTPARGAEVTPLGVQVVAYPDATSARAAMAQTRATAAACTGVDLGAWGLDGVREAPAGSYEAAIELMPSGDAVYAHSLLVQDGLYVVSVSRSDADGGVPADALTGSSAIVDDVLKALTAAG